MDKSRLLDIFSKIKKEERPENFHKNSRVLLVDGMNTFLRGFAAVNKVNHIGHEIGGLIGFLKSIGSAIKLLNPSRVIIVFDGETGSSNRKYLYPGYKGNRDNSRVINKKVFSDKSLEDESKYNQLVRLIDYLSYLPLQNVSISSLEADDIIAHLTYLITKNNADSQVYIMSTDNDYIQLMNDRVRLYSPTKKRIYHVEHIVKEFGAHPNNFALYKAIVGDGSDNIPGVNGVGEKNAPKLFEFLSDPEEKSIEYLFESCQNPTKNSILYQRVLNTKKDVETFYRIVNLKNLNITEYDLETIKNTYDENAPVFRKYDFMKTYNHDKMGDAIPNLDTWLNLFSPLSNYK